MRQARVGAVIASAMALLMGCTGTPTPAPAPADASSTGAAPTENAERDQRIREAVTRREDVLTGFWAKPWDKRSWSKVSAGYLPEVERYQDRLNLAMKNKDLYPTRDRLAPAIVYAANSSLAVVSQQDQNESQNVSVFRWRGDELVMLYTFPWTHSSLMPKAERQASIAPSDATLVKQLIRYWESGRLPEKTDLQPNGAPFTFATRFDEPGIQETTSCRLYEQGGDRFAWTLPVEIGMLSLVAIECTYRARSGSDFTIGLGEDEAKMTGDHRVVYQRLDCREIYQMRVLMGDTDQVKWETVGAQPLDVCARS